MTDQAQAPPGRTIGVEEKPRALLSWDGADQDRVAEALTMHAPTVREIRSLLDVRQADYDLLVTDRMVQLTSRPSGNSQVPSRHLGVISFLPPLAGDEYVIDKLGPWLEVRSRRYHLANSIEVPGDLLDAVRDLVADDLVPAVRARPGGGHTSFEVANYNPGARPPSCGPSC